MKKNYLHLEIRGGLQNPQDPPSYGPVVQWPLMAGLLHLVQREGDWAPSRCTKCNSPPTNDQCTNHRIAV